MTETDRCPGGGHRGSVNDQPAGEVSTDGIPQQLRRRRAASWRLPPLADGSRDPWGPVQPDDWTDREVEAWQATAEHLRAHGLYGRWQLPDSVRVAWYRRRSVLRRCRCGAA